ncbi:MAG: NAD(P)-dependent oxidoreductase [Aggregatilineales bacterium]
MRVHIGYSISDRDFALLQDKLTDGITLSKGDDAPSDYQILIAGRPSREQLTASPDLQTMIIPWAGLPATTADLMHEFPQIAIHNLHHNAIPTAEMALALLFATARLLIPSDRDFRQHDWTPRYQPYPSVMLHGKRVLIAGYGAIGQYLGGILKAMGMQVYGIRRRNIDENAGIYPPEKLHDLLPEADVLLITLPGTSATEKLFGATELALLPQGAIVINVGRAAVIDGQAFYEALRDGHLFGGAQDVWWHYPPDEAARTHTPPADFPFHDLDNMVMSPHRAGGGANVEIEALRVSALATVLNQAARGATLPHRVDLDAGY